MLNLPSEQDNETAEDILIYLNFLSVSEHSDHIQRHLTVVDPQDDKDSLIAEVATIVQTHTTTTQQKEQERVTTYLQTQANGYSRKKGGIYIDQVGDIIEGMIRDLYPDSQEIGS